MANPVTLINKNTNEIRKSATGFSFTMLCWGPFPPLFRSDWKWGIIILIINLASNAILPGSVIITGIIFGVTYNKTHLNDLMNLGFVPQGDKALVDAVYFYAGRQSPDKTEEEQE